MHLLDISWIKSSRPDIRLGSRIASFKPAFERSLTTSPIFGRRLTVLPAYNTSVSANTNLGWIWRYRSKTPWEHGIYKSQRSRIITSYLCPHISSRARKYTTNARSSKSNDDSVGWICYNGYNERLVGSPKHFNKHNPHQLLGRLL